MSRDTAPALSPDVGPAKAEPQPEKNEELHSRLLEAMQETVTVFDGDGNILFANPRAAQNLGAGPPQEVIGRNLRELIPPEFADRHIEDYRKVLRSGSTLARDLKTVLQGQERWFHNTLTPLPSFGPGGRPAVLSVSLDIGDRIRAEEALGASERKFRAIFNSTFQFIGLLRADGILLEANETALAFSGQTAAEVVGKPFWDARWWAGSPETRARLREAIARAASGDFVRYEVTLQGTGDQLVTIDFSLKPVHEEGAPVMNILAEGRDISARTQAEERLRASLEEKELLLREIHHRVKNNLTVLISLIDLQADLLTDPQTLGSFAELRERIRTIAFVHDELYRSDDLGGIDFGAYGRRLAENLFEVYPQERPVALRFDIADVFLDINRGIPCGLILTELVTNALKYAFPAGWQTPGDRPCEVSVALRRDGERIELTVADNGIGLPPDLDWQTAKSLGLRLVRVLATQQLGGTVEVETRPSHPGSSFRITVQERRRGSSAHG